MKYETTWSVIALFAVALVAMFVIGFYQGKSSARDWTAEQMERRLIERGYAEWVVVDSVTGRTELKIKECLK
jgi:hypothetical protein